ncbi:hypothetical protein ILUMI_06568, partial [Ignelater luminosus]
MMLAFQSAGGSKKKKEKWKEYLREHFSEVLEESQVAEDISEDKSSPESQLTALHMETGITIGKLEFAMKKLKLEKAMGGDRIAPEMENGVTETTKLAVYKSVCSYVVPLKRNLYLDSKAQKDFSSTRNEVPEEEGSRVDYEDTGAQGRRSCALLRTHETQFASAKVTLVNARHKEAFKANVIERLVRKPNAFRSKLFTERGCSDRKCYFTNMSHVEHDYASDEDMDSPSDMCLESSDVLRNDEWTN